MKQLDSLTLNEVYFKQLIESSVDLFFKLNENGDFTYASPAAQAITGYLPDELTGLNFFQLLKLDIRSFAKRFYDNQLKEKTETTYLELPIIKKDGSITWIGQNISIEQNLNGFSLIGVARDVNEKVNSDKQKDNWISRLLVLIENLQEGVLMEDENRKITLVNRAFCDLFAVRLIPEDLIGKNYINAQNHIKRLFEDPKTYSLQEDDVRNNRHILIGQSLNLADGRVYERDFVPLYIETGYSGNLWKYRDSTEKTRIRRELIKSEKKYKNVIEAMRLGLMEVDKNDNIITANDAFCEILGYETVNDLVGKPSFQTLLDEEQQELMKQQMATREKGDSNTYEIKARRADGGHAWMLISGAPLFDENDNVVGSMGIHLDITHQKRIAIELEEKKALQSLMVWQEKAMENLEEKVLERTSEVLQQKEIIENKSKEITKSIDYALLIQKALLPKTEDISKAFKEHFILYRPKDIVSGDFYFFSQLDESSCYICAADSTGHGVPGGFMSMLGSEKLSVALSKGGSPGEILAQMNRSIKNTLRNIGEEIGLLDGFDMALCKVDLKNLIVEYAGALRPIWIIRKGATTIEEIRGTRRSIGGRTEESQLFDTHVLQLNAGDTIYLFTDGYTDQFSHSGVRLTTKRLSEVLLTIQDKSILEQEIHMTEFLNQWQGHGKQTDDILLIGIKF
ncbi:MAG: PAS domain S-box protein [Bacteroidia bacterium]|nr:PAS domain S-box protein [Bacteroidia bacterium]